MNILNAPLIDRWILEWILYRFLLQICRNWHWSITGQVTVWTSTLIWDWNSTLICSLHVLNVSKIFNNSSLTLVSRNTQQVRYFLIYKLKGYHPLRLVKMPFCLQYFDKMTVTFFLTSLQVFPSMLFTHEGLSIVWILKTSLNIQFFQSFLIFIIHRIVRGINKYSFIEL